MQSTKRTVPKTPKKLKTSSSDSGEPVADPVNVFCRIRPLIDANDGTCLTLLSPTVLTLNSASDLGVAKSTEFTFKHIFTSHAKQKEIYDHVALPLLEDLMKGTNGLLFTYGVTGSGKTFTLNGEQDNPGVMPRCINSIFNSIGNLQARKYIIKTDKMNGFEIQSESDALADRKLEARASNKNLKSKKSPTELKSLYTNDDSKVNGVNENSIYSVFISYIEIYNNAVYDLLDESTGRILQAKIVREDSKKNMYVFGGTEVEVKSSVEAFELFYSGQKRKRMAQTTLNTESSRSHSIFTIRLAQLEQVVHDHQGRPIIPDTNLLRVGQLSLVDLAGSERCNRAQTTGLRLKEAGSINNSLMSLRTCLEILRENQLTESNKIVPYRDSKLTLLFKNFFEGDGRVQMIVCVNPSLQDYEENQHVLKFAEKAQEVKVTRAEARYTPYRQTPKIKKITSSAQTPSVHSHSLGPKIPVIQLNFDNLESSIPAIENVLKVVAARIKKDENYYTQLNQRADRFRKRLINIQKENVLSKMEIHSLKSLFDREKLSARELERKNEDLEMNNINLVTKNEELNDVVRKLTNTVDEKDLKINQDILEREKSKQNLALRTNKLQKEWEEKRRLDLERHEAEVLAKENKLRQVRQILDNETVLITNRRDAETGTDLSEQVQTTATTCTSAQQERMNRRHTPYHTDLRRRRSRSSGEVWLEHNAVKPVPLGTVLQPTMKKRKSVSKLDRAADITNPKQNKYCLIAQERDIDGEVETKVYKGDILPTCGGGAQVIFNDVERLRQDSPTK